MCRRGSPKISTRRAAPPACCVKFVTARSVADGKRFFVDEGARQTDRLRHRHVGPDHVFMSVEEAVRKLGPRTAAEGRSVSARVPAADPWYKSAWLCWPKYQ